MNKTTALLLKYKTVGLFFILTVLYTFYPLLTSKTPAFAFVHEHFFNTLQIIENFKTAGFPTFDFVTKTNDFSLVWAGILYLLSYVADIHTTSFFIVVRVITAVFGWTAAFLMNKLLKRLEFSPSDAALFLINAFFAAMYLEQATTATESCPAVLTVFLTAYAALNMLEKPCFSNGFLCGLAVCLSFLTGFDSMGFVLTFVLVFYFQFNGKVPVTLKDFFKFIPGLAVGLLPLYAWTAFSTFYFNSFVPPKILSWRTVQSVEPWNMFLLLVWYPIRYFKHMSTELITILMPLVACVLTAITSFPKEAKTQTPKDTLFLSLLWFPFLQFAIFSLFTYVDLPLYAFYPLCVASPFAIAFVFKKYVETLADKPDELKQMDIASYVLSGVLFLIAFGIFVRPLSAVWLKPATKINAFMQENKGLYAMGKGAGIVSYITHTPFMRIDGLAMNDNLINAIKQNKELVQTLKEHNVAYYVAFNVQKSQCYAPREPAPTLFGVTNKAMGGWLCEEPLLKEKISPNLTLFIFKVPS